MTTKNAINMLEMFLKMFFEISEHHYSCIVQKTLKKIFSFLFFCDDEKTYFGFVVINRLKTKNISIENTIRQISNSIFIIIHSFIGTFHQMNIQISPAILQF